MKKTILFGILLCAQPIWPTQPIKPPSFLIKKKHQLQNVADHLKYHYDIVTKGAQKATELKDHRYGKRILKRKKYGETYAQESIPKLFNNSATKKLQKNARTQLKTDKSVEDLFTTKPDSDPTNHDHINYRSVETEAKNHFHATYAQRKNALIEQGGDAAKGFIDASKTAELSKFIKEREGIPHYKWPKEDRDHVDRLIHANADPTEMNELVINTP